MDINFVVCNQHLLFNGKYQCALQVVNVALGTLVSVVHIHNCVAVWTVGITVGLSEPILKNPRRD